MDKLPRVIAASLLGLASATVSPLISASVDSDSSNAYADNGVILIPGGTRDSSNDSSGREDGTGGGGGPEDGTGGGGGPEDTGSGGGGDDGAGTGGTSGSGG
ncbi:hypothetical protein ILFOPFJJ_03338 [Ensifer psoraleae]|uniref:hypothetical protein n=1 Tax=Sinorhizobium TaxID=28105 RepID=UPI0015685543|nr:MULTISPECIES: hypothetical protein [Sinorhizobium]MDK1385329.1 hypothetical protein [Sinorhizobium sp. 7-81]NRP72440.1 hypothetical protein [Sinorhizobium psoraleae]